MAFDTALGSERFPVVGAIDPDAYTAATYTSGWIDMSRYDRIVAIVLAGDLGGSGTLAAKLEKSLLESPAVAADVAGKSITTLTQASPNDSNKQAIINCRADELGPNDGYRYVRLSMTVATATSDCGALIIGVNKKLEDGSSQVNALGTELVAVVGAIDPDAYAPATLTSDALDMSKFGRALAVVLAGETGATNQITAKLEQATTSGGTYKDVSGKTITTVDGTASPTQADVQRTIDCRADELDINNDFRWLRLSMTVTDTTSPETATSDAAGVLIGLDPRYAPAADNDLASVAEIVS